MQLMKSNIIKKKIQIYCISFKFLQYSFSLLVPYLFLQTPSLISTIYLKSSHTHFYLLKKPSPTFQIIALNHENQVQILWLSFSNLCSSSPSKSQASIFLPKSTHKMYGHDSNALAFQLQPKANKTLTMLQSMFDVIPKDVF